MKYWGGKLPPPWVQEIASERARPLVSASEPSLLTPRPGDIVLKPVIDRHNYRQLFRVETWETHALLEGPFDNVREAMECAYELAATSHLSVWLDYSDNPDSHDLDDVPLYEAEKSAEPSST